MRCAYCHNPDTWEIGKGREITVQEILEEFEKNRPFYKNGGITVTGGEPLLQVDFLIELFKNAKMRNIHTCIDTSGITYDSNNKSYISKLDELVSLCDLVMLDIKHIDSNAHIKLTGKDNKNILSFAKYLEEKNIPLWVRHVVIPGITDNSADLVKLGEFIGNLKNLKALDVLPYHTMGINKYKELGIPYPLEGIAPVSSKGASNAKAHILRGIQNVRQK